MISSCLGDISELAAAVAAVATVAAVVAAVVAAAAAAAAAVAGREKPILNKGYKIEPRKDASKKHF